MRKKDFQVSPDIFSFFQESEISTEWTSSSRKTSCGFISTEVVDSIYRGGNEIRIWGAPRDRHDRVWALIARLPVVSPQINHGSCRHAWLAIVCQVFPSVAWSRWSNVFFFRPDFTWGSQQASVPEDTPLVPSGAHPIASQEGGVTEWLRTTSQVKRGPEFEAILTLS